MKQSLTDHRIQDHLQININYGHKGAHAQILHNVLVIKNNQTDLIMELVTCSCYCVTIKDIVH